MSGSFGREYADFNLFEEEAASSSRLVAERLVVGGVLRESLQAARRDLAAFSSGMALRIVGISEAAIVDILNSKRHIRVAQCQDRLLRV